jgi:hypothetical protein
MKGRRLDLSGAGWEEVGDVLNTVMNVQFPQTLGIS